jgi:putative cardiolipin synthase
MRWVRRCWSDLIAAADRGVRVRFLIDDSFLQGRDELIMFVHQHDNMALRVFNPYQRRSSTSLHARFSIWPSSSRLDHRMHNKAMIVDGQIAIVGGRNLADEYFGLHAQANFRDLELLVGGPIVDDVGRAFAGYWNSPWSVPVAALSHVTPGTWTRKRWQRPQRRWRFCTERDQDALRAAWTEISALRCPATAACWSTGHQKTTPQLPGKPRCWWRRN